MKIDKGSLLLEDDKIFLRPLGIIDVTEEYIARLNDPEVNRYLVDVRNTAQTRKSIEAFIHSNTEDSSSILLGIFMRDDPDPFIGTLRVSGIDYFHYLASIGICVFAKRAWKRGYAVRSLKIVKDFLFNTAGLHYLEAGVYSENSNSLTLFINAGFTESHRFKDKYRHIDGFKEVIILRAINPSFNFSLLKQDASSFFKT
jgi:RimJ/RimL family protein N-acetyltransferase